MTAAVLMIHATDALDALRVAVHELADDLPRLTEACTAPDATDLAELYADVQDARTKLQAMERDLEHQLGKALLADEVQTDTLRVERYRSRDRKAWDHDQWRRDVRQQLLRKHGLLGAQGVVTADGEVVDASVLHEVLSELFDVQGKKEPTTTGLRGLGLDAMDYCETSAGTVHVRVHRLADETEGTES